MDGRPGTGMRGGQLGPLGVAGGGLGGAPMRPPTGLRQSLGTARMGTAMQGARAGLGPLNTNIQVAERPVTQQGMMGMKVQPQGPGRQVQDRSYYMAELRKRCDAQAARIKNLEVDSKGKREKLVLMLNKSGTDDQLISALRSELDKHRARAKAGGGGGGGGGGAAAESGGRAKELAAKLGAQQVQIDRQEP